MAEFDSTAFSAVDNFFVIDRKPDDGVKDVTKTTANTGKARRLGVGAKVSKPEETSAAASKMLMVGKKKRGREDENEEEEHTDVHHDEDDDEEEVGRTGIVSEQNTSKLQDQKHIEGSNQQKKKKKKKGKKERQKEKEVPESEDIAKEEDISEERLSKENTKKDNLSIENDESMDAPIEKVGDNQNNDGQQKNQKRRRRKVRSRQKNIYKDNRPLHEKPDHLVPGGYDYKGRPITPATKEKLVTKKILPVGSTKGSWLNQPTTAEGALDEHNHEHDAGDDDMGAPMLKKTTAPPKATVSNKGKKKNRKYKNLV